MDALDPDKIEHLIGLISTWRTVDAERDDAWEESLDRLLAIQLMLDDLVALLRGKEPLRTPQMVKYLEKNPYYR